MPERTGAPLFLLARFAEFFESVVDSKRAISEGRLGAVLSVGDEPQPTDPRELAARLSAKLAAVLRLQEKRRRAPASRPRPTPIARRCM